jgi:small subunit ribosomal protein S20
MRFSPLAFPRRDRQNSRLFFPSVNSVANIKSAEKRARQTVKRRAHNMAMRSKLRTAIKSVANAVTEGDKQQAATNLKAAGPIIDSMVNKGIIHRNKAARHKSQLSAQVKELSAS